MYSDTVCCSDYVIISKVWTIANGFQDANLRIMFYSIVFFIMP